MNAMAMARPAELSLPGARSPVRIEGSLAALAPGEGGIVIGLDLGRGEAVAKLLALGVVPGQAIEVESVGPAVVFRLGATRFAVDHALASAVRVQPATPATDER